jgi:hypothetical protein
LALIPAVSQLHSCTIIGEGKYAPQVCIEPVLKLLFLLNFFNEHIQKEHNTPGHKLAGTNFSDM